ncbi:energy-coupling factor ABC transporter ATP-binding protein [Thermodesulfovibrio yellowstonii]|uniref:ABC transporter ATP-binding protein n=1 Tax=Thermodesulfovibrio yellowstonii TaxID=28262 RepID=A0A9W6LIW3_9BACT|nr:ATP-binding cassette domain-containing protein [Thermodesulfovibrio islandicus]GLI52576.1 ABC transporter ATP-binding protein [Thermodesulfovibrio islandicus]
MELKLIVKNLYKYYNEKPLFENCSYTFDRSGVYVLMGPNGSGKSTFLRMCAFLENPDRGEINYFEGNKVLPKDINLMRRITLLLPEVGVFNTTVFKNVAYGLKIRGFKNNKIKEKVEEALQFVGLSHKKEQNALTLSTGETKRMGIARALVLEPEVLFLDEPTASVDWKNTEIIENIIIQLKQRLNSIIVIATHDKESARRAGDFLLYIKDGRIDTKHPEKQIL